MEDPSNRSRLAKLLRFQSSNGKGLTSLEDYASRMKPKQEHVYWLAGASRADVEKSPFVERLLARGYEVLYLVEAVDEYAIGALPEYDGKKFQNVAKEGFSLDSSEESKAKLEELKKEFEPLTKWLDDVALKDRITRSVLSERLSESPCALVAGLFGWTGNMERLALSNAHQKADDAQRSYYLNQRKTLEINPRHPLIKELLRRVQADEADAAKDLALMMFRTATLRSGYMLQETADFADSIERLMRQTLGISLDEKSEQEVFADEPAENETDEAAEASDDADADAEATGKPEDSEEAEDGELDLDEHDEL